VSLTWSRVLAWRQRRHLLDRAVAVSAADVAPRLIDIQADESVRYEEAHPDVLVPGGRYVVVSQLVGAP
jgi:hypothetical protein